MMNNTFENPTEWLRWEFNSRRIRNPRFSLRAYAKLIGIAPGRLSEIFSGKRLVTAATMNNAARRLGLPPEVKQQFECQLNPKKKAYQLGENKAAEPVFSQVDDDIFNSIAEPYHFAILSLVETRGFKSQTSWISKRLGITANEADDAVNRLCRLGLLKWTEKKLSLTSSAFAAKGGISSRALRFSHRRSLERGIASLEYIPIDKRDVSSVTMAIDPSKIPEAKEAIRKFRNSMTRILEKGNRSEVYELNVQLIPFTILED